MWMHPWALWLLAAVAAVAAVTWWRPIRRSTVVASIHLWRDVVAAAGSGRPRRCRGVPPLAWWLLLGGSVAAVVAVAGPVERTTPPPVASPPPAPALMTFDAVEAVAVGDGTDQLFVALRSHVAFARAVVMTVLVEPSGTVLSTGFVLPPGGRVVRVFDVPASATRLHVLAGGDGALSATVTRRRSSDAAVTAFGRDNPCIRKLMRAMAGRHVPADPDGPSFAVAVAAEVWVAPPSLEAGPFGAMRLPEALTHGGADVRHARPWVGSPEPPAVRAVAPADALRMLLAEGSALPTPDEAPRILETSAPPPAAAAFEWITRNTRRTVWVSDVPTVVRSAVPPAPAAPPGEGRWEAPALVAGLLWLAGWRRLGRIL